MCSSDVCSVIYLPSLLIDSWALEFGVTSQFYPSLISLVVSVDVKHDVYLLGRKIPSYLLLPTLSTGNKIK